MTNDQIQAAKKGLEGIVAAATRISHVDGQAGQLIIGGYALEEIAGKAEYDEVSWILWNLGLGKEPAVPTQNEYDALLKEVATYRSIPDAALSIVKAARHAPPMDALRMTVSMMSLDDPAPNDESLEADYRRAKILSARIPTIIAAHDRARRGLDPIAPSVSL